MSVPNEDNRTLGFLAGNLHVGMAPRLWPGMIAAARKHGVNLFCFPGGSTGLGNLLVSEQSRVSFSKEKT